MRALVTGCAGFIGSHLAEALLADGHAVVGIDCFNDNYGRSQKLENLREVGASEAFEFVPVDLAQGDLADLTEGCAAIFHLAAEPGVRSSWGSRYGRYVQNNMVATQHLLEAVKDRADVRFVHASSSSVYGNAVVRPTPEEAPASPLSPYGQTKLGAEHLCGLYRETYGLDVVSLRYFTVFGPRQRPDMAFHAFCRAALAERPITVFGDGRQTRDFTYVGDVVAVTLAAGAAAATAPGIPTTFNVGGGTPTSLRRAIDVIGELAGRPLEVRYAEPKRGEARDTAADTSRAAEALGFAPQVSLEDGLAAQFEWAAACFAAGGALLS